MGMIEKLSPALWLDASSLGLMQYNANNVVALLDRSENDNRAVQSTASLQPELRPDALNGKSVILSNDHSYFTLDKKVLLKVFYLVTFLPGSPDESWIVKTFCPEQPITMVNVNFAEIIGFSEELSDEDESMIYEYLSDKWAAKNDRKG